MPLTSYLVFSDQSLILYSIPCSSKAGLQPCRPSGDESNPYCFRVQLWLDDTHLQAELLRDTNAPFIYSLEARHHRIKQQVWGGSSRHSQIVHISRSLDGSCMRKPMEENRALMMHKLLPAA